MVTINMYECKKYLIVIATLLSLVDAASRNESESLTDSNISSPPTDSILIGSKLEACRLRQKDLLKLGDEHLDIEYGNLSSFDKQILRYLSDVYKNIFAYKNG